MYNLVLSAEAEKIYISATQSLAKKLARCFEQLEQNPRLHPNIKPLKGNLSGYYRYRIGEHRVVYEIDDTTNQIIVTNIAHRSKVYE